jgi:DNA-binding GntR family transcriptional regulator
VEAYVVRSELESLAARLAIPNMTEADLRELIHYGAQMHKAARVGDGHAVATADANFHAKIVEMTGNGTLKRLWGTLEPFSRTYITLVMPGADPLWSARLHDPIVDALRGRDVRAVVRALRRHFADASSMLATHWLDAERSASAPETSPTAAGGGSNTGSSRGDVGRPKPNRVAAPE